VDPEIAGQIVDFLQWVNVENGGQPNPDTVTPEAAVKTAAVE